MSDADHARHDALDAESWAFALQIYAQPRVAESCLRLQAEMGVDVMMLLISAFAAARLHIALKASDIAELDAACRPWREQIVQPLRGIRVTLKSGPPPAPDGATERLRSQVKTSELAAERIQNRILAGLLLTRKSAPQPLTREEIRVALGGVATYAMQKRGNPDAGAAMPLLDLIVDALQAI